MELSRDLIEKAVMGYLGDIDQIPPMYSALKSNGKVPPWYKEPEDLEALPFLKKEKDDMWFKVKDIMEMLNEFEL